MPEPQPRLITNRAADDLTYIRSAMERSSAFTAVPGAGGVATGVIGLIAAVVGAWQPTGERWLAAWLGAASIAVVVELAAMTWKARRPGIALTGKNARRFALGTAAPLVAGGAITYGLWVMRDFSVMAPAWLLLYGVGVLTGGMFSVPVVRALGACFMAAGIAASLTLPEWGNVWLGIGFGGLHVGFGAYIARYHGGQIKRGAPSQYEGSARGLDAGIEHRPGLRDRDLARSPAPRPHAPWHRQRVGSASE